MAVFARPVRRPLGIEPARSGATALPGRLRDNLEALSGLALDGVRVHRASSLPGRLAAEAVAFGTRIHLAAGAEHRLPHEAWHVVQQMQGRVRTTGRLAGMPVNHDPGLEREADLMGGRARDQAAIPRATPPRTAVPVSAVLQGYFTGRADGGDARLKSHAAEPAVTVQEDGPAADYPRTDIDATGAEFRISDDQTLAVQAAAAEPTEFFATAGVLAAANAALARVESPLVLKQRGNEHILMGGTSLLAIEPDPALAAAGGEGAAGESAAALRQPLAWTEVCIELAAILMGNFRNPTSGWEDVVLGGGEDATTAARIVVSNTEAPGIRRLARHLAEPAPIGGRAAAVPGVRRLIRYLTIRRALAALRSRDYAADQGKVYGDAVARGDFAGKAKALGVNQFADPAVGEGFATFSLFGPGGSALDYTSGIPVMRERPWGYHHGAVVARSSDKKDVVTLENYRRDKQLKEGMAEHAEYFAAMGEFRQEWEGFLEKARREAETMDAGGDTPSTEPMIRQRAFADWMPNNQRVREAYGKVSEKTAETYKNLWFFHMYGSGSDQSFHAQQSASGAFANPLTVRVRRTPRA